jgi:hypothetical protein
MPYAPCLNSIRFQLKMGTFLPSPGLAKDWQEMGEQNFVLKALEAMWLEKLSPSESGDIIETSRK